MVRCIFVYASDILQKSNHLPGRYCYVKRAFKVAAQEAASRDHEAREKKPSLPLAPPLSWASFLSTHSVMRDNMVTAIDLWEDATTRGKHGRSAFALGCLYHHGRGVPQSDRKAWDYYQLAVKRNGEGSGAALNALGALSAQGRGGGDEGGHDDGGDDTDGDGGVGGARDGTGGGGGTRRGSKSRRSKSGGGGDAQDALAALIWYDKAISHGSTHALFNLANAKRREVVKKVHACTREWIRNQEKKKKNEKE